MINKIIELLKSKEYSFSEILNELKKEFEISRKDLINYLRKIAKISKNKNWKLYYRPSVCKKCNFIAKDFKPISKCPKCKSEWLEEPIYFIKED
ncbi:MAG: transcriptional regulator [Candidatus Aenigmatarchaeota archaeon]